jgi:hypothetical protein
MGYVLRSAIHRREALAVSTAWVKKPFHTKGLDPLAVQAPCINLYGQLLPGITNVTDRARYYAFYPWVIWTFDQLPGTKVYADLVDWVRRADCLFTMIGIRHRLVADDNDPLKHDTGLIGNQTLRPVVAKLRSGDRIRLADYTVREDGNPRRYFKNPLGGLKQYYLGPFDGLGLMRALGREVRYTPERGMPLAQAFDTAVNRQLFVDTARGDEVTTERLDELGAFCPCQLLHSPQEHEALLTLFFDTDQGYGDEGQQRRRSLGLLLDLAKSLSHADGGGALPFDQHVFRGCVYAGVLPDGTPWDLAPGLERTRASWAVYQRNELLSVAVQCLFWVALQCLEEEQPMVSTTEDFVRWFAASSWVSEATAALEGDDFDAALAGVVEALPAVGEWRLEAHEVALARRALEANRTPRRQEVWVELLSLTSRILLSLIARDDLTNSPYAPLTFPPEYFTLYPINLHSLRTHARAVWPGLKLPAWLGWLAGHWGIEAHLRVALRKLRSQNQDTFHILPSEQGLKVAAMPEPTYTSPY